MTWNVRSSSMAAWRCKAAGGLLLTVIGLGAIAVVGSGSLDRIGSTPNAEVLGVVQYRTTTTVPAATTALATSSTIGNLANIPEPTTTSVTPAPSADLLERPTTTSAVPRTTQAPQNVAPATVVTAPEVQDRGIGELTLERISYPWQSRLPGWTINFLPSRSGIRGLTIPDSKRIEIYVRSSDTPQSLARVVAHELGHAADVSLNDTRDRERWRATRGVEADVPWWPGDGRSDFDTLAGDFAEAFAVWQTGIRSQSTVAEQPSAEQLALLAALVS